MKEDFVLPEKWYVRVTRENMDILRKWRNSDDVLYSVGMWIGMNGNKKDQWGDGCLPKDAPTISFEQFKKYVLAKQKQQKEIVGWKLKEEYVQYKDVAARIANYNPDYDIQNLYLKDSTHNFHGDEIIPILKQAGVLDLWFEPVYKKEEPEYQIGDWVVVKNYVQCGEGNGVVTANLVSELFEVGKNGATGMHYKESAFSVKERGNYYNIKKGHIVRKATPEEIKSAQTPQIIVNGYVGEFLDTYVKFGCAEFNKDIFIILYRQSTHPLEHTNRTIESVTIGKGTFSKEQIKEIAEFYLNK